jgi:hypothetical protein
MSASATRPPEQSMPRGGTSYTAYVTGWERCAGVLLVILGAFNVMNGLVALNNDEFLVNQYLYENLTFWGWSFLVWGALQVIAGALALVGGNGGRILGVTLSMIGAVLWFFFIFASPYSALIGIFINVMVIYGLTAGAVREELAG